MGRRFQITLADQQYAVIRAEAFRSGLPMAEIVRRAIDSAYRTQKRPTLRGFELTMGLWQRPDAAVAGRLEPRRGRPPLD
jgi:hypothetical protein